MRDLDQRYLGADLDNLDRRSRGTPFWERVDRIPGRELWDAHQRQKLELTLFAQGRLRNQFARLGESPEVLEQLEHVLDPSIFTIGFARRFATYKRAGLLFADVDRLARLVNDERRPVQLIFAGKAHPADRPGQQVIQEIFALSRSPKLRGRVFILEDYDVRIARFLVQGVDIWLNTPRRPLEASGTSGMKAAMNGVANMSVLDGWWDEGWQEDNGWAIGDREARGDEPAQDWADSQDIYRLLEEEIVPRYYRRDEDGMPDEWVETMRRAIGTSLWQFSTTRMLHEYVQGCTCRAWASSPRPSPPYGATRAAPAPKSRARPDSTGPVAPGPHGIPGESRMTARSPRISLALAIHNHQPVGNFGWVFEEVYETAYQPFVDLLERHPSVRVSLHYTGPLLQWLLRERPAFVDRVRALVDRGQVELLGGGFYEPVLATLHERDRVAQLRRMGDELEALTGRRPQGAWLAERVWEPSLPTSLVDAAYGWTIVDDVHLRAAGVPDEEHWWAYTTDDQGRRLTVFGTEQGLRYLIPFQPVEEVIEHLRAHATPEGDRIGMMGDDGEKFGAWPTTYEHCWGRGRWMETLLRSARGERRLADDGDAERLVGRPPAGRSRVPAHELVHRDDRVGAAAGGVDGVRHGVARLARRRPARGAIPARRLLAQLPAPLPGDQRPPQADAPGVRQGGCDAARAAVEWARALDHLLQGQSNDCYWHGLFGGIYIAHMRLASYEHLIAAEDAADRARGSGRSGTLADVDLDGDRRGRSSRRRARSSPSSSTRGPGSANGTSEPRATRLQRCSGDAPRRRTSACAQLRPRARFVFQAMPRPERMSPTARTAPTRATATASSRSTRSSPARSRGWAGSCSTTPMSGAPVCCTCWIPR